LILVALCYFALPWPGAAQAPAPGTSPSTAPAGQNQNPPSTNQTQPAPKQQPGNAAPPSSGAAPTASPQQKPQLENPQLENPTPAPAQPTPPAQQPGAAPQKPAAPVTAPAVIESIIFRGNRRIPSSTLRARIFSRSGDVYDENTVDRDFHALWNTGYFDDIRAEVSQGKNGVILTFYLREKKLVRSIDYKGLSSVEQSDVLDRYKERKVGLSIQSQYDPVVVKRAEVALEELLAERGRQFATVHARTRNIPPNSVALTFIVVEGPKVKIGDIRFTGNTVFSNTRLVRTMKYSKPFGAPPSFYWFHKTYDKDKIEADLETGVRSLYQDHGYFTVLVNEPKIKMTDTQRGFPFVLFGKGRGKKVDVTIPVEEGPEYRLGKFTVRGGKLFKPQITQAVLQMKEGDVFNLSKVRKALENYKKLYGSYGYINFVATPDPTPDNKRHIVDLALDFDEGKQFFIHRIEFVGNTKTRDKVIRRELLLNEGDIFSTSLWDYSILRVNQLGFFDPVKKEDGYDIKQNEKDGTVDIDLKVKEKGRNSIGFSGGVSGIAGTFIGVNYSTNNFLGLGETLSIQTEFGTFQKLYSFGFTEPYLLDRPITTGFTVFYSEYHFDQLRQLAAESGFGTSENVLNQLQNTVYGQYFSQNYQQNSKGFTAFASYPMPRRFARLGLNYSYTNSTVIPFSTASTAFFNALQFTQFKGPNQLSGIITSQVTPTLFYNTLNGDLSPTKGKYLSASLGFSGSFLGGNVNTIRPTIEAKYFHPINHGRNVLAFHGLASTLLGYGGLVPPPFDRIYMGGEYDIRGFDIYTISPLGFFPTVATACNLDSKGNKIQSLNSSGQPTGSCGSTTTFPINTLQFLGGDTELLGNFEYRIPIIPERVTLAYFVDIGMPFIWHEGQLALKPTAVQGITQQFPWFLPSGLPEVKPIPVTNFNPRSSTGLELQLMLPVVNAPFRIFYGYNWLRLNTYIYPPAAPPEEMALFPNLPSWLGITRDPSTGGLPYFTRIPLHDRAARLGFTVARQF
jgi:outer membrane protein insertion porin family